jgi:glycosyltransferase involved in cell wall biosynthesis
VADGRGRRVLQLLGPSTGGIRRHVALLTSELQARGWHVETAGPAGVLDGLATLDHVVPVGALPRAVRPLRRMLDRFDVVHAHGLTAGWTAVLARVGRRRKPALVLTGHNVVLDEVSGRAAPALRVLERWLPARTDGVIAVSADVASRLATRSGRDRVTVVGAFGPPPTPTRTAAATRDALGIPSAVPLVVCVARLHPQKGLDVLIDAMVDVGLTAPDARLVIAGEGPLAGELAARAMATGVGDRIQITPPGNPADALAAADVVAIPSRWESGPLVLVEAMLLARPVIATPVGMVPDFVTEGETGWLVPVGDASALAGAILNVLADPTRAAAVGNAGRARAMAAADTDAKVSLVEQVYRASLDDRA